MSEIFELNELENVSGGATAATKRVKIVNCQHRINVRKTPSGKGELAGYAHLGDVYGFYGWSGGWAKIDYNGFVAYIYRDFIQVL